MEILCSLQFPRTYMLDIERLVSYLPNINRFEFGFITNAVILQTRNNSTLDVEQKNMMLEDILSISQDSLSSFQRKSNMYFMSL